MSRPTPQWSLHVTHERQDGIAVLGVSGRLGAASLDAFRAALDEAACEPRLVLDLSGLDYISSAGLLALDDARSNMESRSGRLVLCGVSDATRVAFDLANLSAHFTTEPSREVAIARLSGG